jgi:hypothetical protein
VDQPRFLARLNRELVHLADMKSSGGVDEAPEIPVLLENVKLPAASGSQ